MNEPKTGTVDPQTLLSLYGMYSGAAGAGGGLLGSVGVGLTTSSTPSTLISPSTTPSPYSTGSPAPQTTSSAASLLHNTSSTTLGLAASQAQALGIMSASNTWWNMASQLAAQEYLSRLTGAGSAAPAGGQDQAAATEYLTRLAAVSAAASAASLNKSSIQTNPLLLPSVSISAVNDPKSMSDYISLMQTAAAAMSRDPMTTNASSMISDPSSLAAALSSRDTTQTAALSADSNLAAALAQDPNLAAALSRDPSLAALLQAQSLIPGLEMSLTGSGGGSTGKRLTLNERKTHSPAANIRHSSPVSLEKHLKLPSDTQILKAPSYGGSRVRDGAGSPVITLPTGLTIEKKRPGKKNTSSFLSNSKGDLVDRVEITRIQGGHHQNGLDLSSSRLSGGLDLSSSGKNGLDLSTDGGLDLSRSGFGKGGDQNGESPLNLSTKSDLLSKKSQEFDGGLSIAEQIRQQELASQLHKHLQQPGSLSAMQALLSLGRIHSDSQASKGDKMNFGYLDGKSGMASILAAASSKAEQEAIAGLLASARGAMHANNDALIPELTIRPVYRNNSEKDGDSIAQPSDEESNHADGGKKGGSQSHSGRQVVTDPEELKIPLQYGWKRETTIRELNKSGVRGEVVYVAPCGKKFKQYPDIIRYVEKHGMHQIKRTHFSFSTKLMVGHFLKPTGTIDSDGVEKYDRYTAEEMSDELDKIRKESGWKPRKRGKSQGVGRKSIEEHTTTSKEDEEAKLNAVKDQVNLQKETIRLLKESEKKEKAEQSKRDKEKQFEEKKRKQEEQIRAKQEEKMKKLRDIELKKQQAAILKEQDKERRREHMVIIRQLENKKRNEERKKKIEDLKVEREKEAKRKVEARRIEIEIGQELKRPIEDMALAQDKPLPEIGRVPGLELTGDEFANLLMVFEFIHNFGETLNFDMEAIPSLDVFQSAILNHSPDAEDELIGILVHLVMVCVEDPGVPNPLKQLTLLGQNLRQVEVTAGNISEVLRIFLRARAQQEIKLHHNLSPPEPKDKKEASLGPFLHADAEYLGVLADNTTWQMAEWVKDKPYLALNPRQKTDILAYLCNELLNNKAVVNQIENTVENIQVVKRKKLICENKVKKLKILHHRKYKFKAEIGRLEENTNASNISFDTTITEDRDDSMSAMSDSNTMTSTATTPSAISTGGRRGGKKKKGGRGGGKGKKEEAGDESEGEGGGKDAPSDGEEEEDEEEDKEEEGELSAEDLQKKIEKVARLARKREEEFNFANNSLRATDLGQDRYRRKYWSFAHVGGIWVESLESGDPEEYKINQANPNTTTVVGFNDIKAETKDGVKPELLLNGDGPPAKKLKLDEKLENKENVKDFLIPDTKKDIIEVIGTSKKESVIKKNELIAPRPKVTPSGERMNLFNHTAYFNMTLSESVINGSLSNQNTDSQTFGIARVNMETDNNEQEKPWFNLAASSQDIMSLVNGSSGEPDYHPGRPEEQVDPMVPYLASLHKQLEEVKQRNTCSNIGAIPEDKSHGWWKLDQDQDLAKLDANLVHRGIREQNLHTNIRRGFEIIQESTHKLPLKELELTTTADQDEAIWPRVITGVPSTYPVAASVNSLSPSAPLGTWSRQVALRVEKMILEQIEGLEDKVASASMQVPGWKVPDRLLSDTLKLRPSCEEDAENDPESVNVVEVCRQRLLELEAAVERRYLKAPLGNSRIASLQSIAALSEKSKLEESLDEKMEEGEDNKENKDDTEAPEDNSDENKENLDKANNQSVAESENDDAKKKDSEGNSITRGLLSWRTAVETATNTSQLALAYQQLESSIAWDKSIMKARCQFCHGEQDEDALLLCDSCDKAFHMYCFKPELESVPDGDWYCWECVNKATGLRHCLVCGNENEENIILCSTCPRAYHTNCITPHMSKVPRGKWSCPGCSNKSPRKNNKAARGARIQQQRPRTPTPEPELEQEEEKEELSEEQPVVEAEKEDEIHELPPVADDKEEPAPEPIPEPAVNEKKPMTRKKSSRATKAEKAAAAAEKAAEAAEKAVVAAKKEKERDPDKDLGICVTVITELAGHDESWPFINPVNTKQFPTYKKIIKHPMDITTVRRKLNDGMYKSRDDFYADVLLIFTNCKRFNEDDSPVGRAGQLMKKFFESRWTELLSGNSMEVDS